MIRSLRARVLLVVLCLNAGAFGFGGVLLYLDLREDSEVLVKERTSVLLDSLARTLANRIRPGSVNTANRGARCSVADWSGCVSFAAGPATRSTRTTSGLAARWRVGSRGSACRR